MRINRKSEYVKKMSIVQILALELVLVVDLIRMYL